MSVPHSHQETPRKVLTLLPTCGNLVNMNNATFLPASDITAGAVVVTGRGLRTVGYKVVGHDDRVYLYTRDSRQIWGGCPREGVEVQ